MADGLTGSLGYGIGLQAEPDKPQSTVAGPLSAAVARKDRREREDRARQGRIDANSAKFTGVGDWGIWNKEMTNKGTNVYLNMQDARRDTPNGNIRTEAVRTSLSDYDARNFEVGHSMSNMKADRNAIANPNNRGKLIINQTAVDLLKNDPEGFKKAHEVGGVVPQGTLYNLVETEVENWFVGSQKLKPSTQGSVREEDGVKITNKGAFEAGNKVIATDHFELILNDQQRRQALVDEGSREAAIQRISDNLNAKAGTFRSETKIKDSKGLNWTFNSGGGGSNNKYNVSYNVSEAEPEVGEDTDPLAPKGPVKIERIEIDSKTKGELGAIKLSVESEVGGETVSEQVAGVVTSIEKRADGEWIVKFETTEETDNHEKGELLTLPYSSVGQDLQNKYQIPHPDDIAKGIPAEKGAEPEKKKEDLRSKYKY